MSHSALVVTVVHHPDDARIRHRQIDALLAAGWQVTYAAPWSAHNVPPTVGVRGLDPVELPRSSGRDRLPAIRAARELLASRASEVDVVLLHDPELVLATVGLGLDNVVLDVHEDTAAAVEVRPWVPDALRGPTAWAVRRVERLAERRMPLLLAEEAYTERFAQDHPVVLNTAVVPEYPVPAGDRPDPDGRHRVVYLGSLTLERGAAELVEVGRRLAQVGGPVVEVVGAAQGPARQIVERAHDEGFVRWHGFVPSDRALLMLDGALAGLSLLHDVANYRHSMPTKVVEYLAHGLPVITTPLPVARELVERSGGGVVVPFGDIDSVVVTLLAWSGDPARAVRMGDRGHAVVSKDYDWAAGAQAFVDVMTELAERGRRR